MMRAKLRNWQPLGGVLVLVLGVFLFGAVHLGWLTPSASRLLLFWSIGTLVVAYTLKSPAAFGASLLLASAWSAWQTLHGTANPCWVYGLWLGAVLVPALFHRWNGVWRLALASLLLWCALVPLAPTLFGRAWIPGERVALLQVYLFGFIALYIVGRGMWWYPRSKPLHAPAITAGAVGASVALFILTFPSLQRYAVRAEFVPLPSGGWVAATTVALLAVAGLMIWRYRGTRLSSLPLYRQAAFFWLVVAGGLALGNLLLPGDFSSWAALGYNLLSLTGVVWLILTGVDRGERRLVNVGFLFLAVLLGARSVDVLGVLVEPPGAYGLVALALAAVLPAIETGRRMALRRLRRGPA